MWQSIRNFILRPNIVLGLYIIFAIIASTQAILLATHTYSGRVYTEYNNYVIFKQSFYHLLSGKNLYVLYPDQYWDLYKYSPTFAFAMGLLAHLPDAIGLGIWDLINTLALFAAIRMLPFKSATQCLLLLFVLLELLTSLQNSQSNGLMAGLIIAAYGCMQRGKIHWATLWLVIATFIKVYGAIGFCLFLFYPGKIKFIAYSALWTILLAILPLVEVSWHELVWQYHNWAAMMVADESASYGLSVMGWLHSWFGVINGKRAVSIIGILLFFIPLLRIKLYRNEVYKLLMLAFILLWVIIFNHKAESPTYIIAVAGAGIWYFAMPKATWRTVLLWFVFIFTSLSATDIFPPFVRTNFIYPYTIKAFPCILVWCVVFIELLLIKNDEKTDLQHQTL